MAARDSERIERYLRGEVEVVAPRDAATVVLLRDGERSVEAYLMHRTSTMAFGAGMHVFPGGSVEPGDRDERLPWESAPPAGWAEAFSCDFRLASALVCAAVRETFEESGVLLAAHADGRVVSDTSGSGWEADRAALTAGELGLAGLLGRRGLRLRPDLLRPWAHWITPAWSPRRFDTRFFVAALPDGQQTREVGGEADRVAWRPVGEALDDYHAGTLTMMRATVSTLRDLAEHRTVASALAATRRIRPVQLRAVVTDGAIELTYDTEHGPASVNELIGPLDDRTRRPR